MRFGERFRVEIFGASHAKQIGCTIDGCPKGTRISLERIQADLERRRPGTSVLTTKRNEPDRMIVRDGISGGVATGKKITLVIENKDVDSRPYEKFSGKPRPGHADYTAHIKYGPGFDMRGGGPFSGRMTAAMVMAGGVAKQILESHGIEVAAFITQIGRAKIPGRVEDSRISRTPVAGIACPDAKAALEMKNEVENASLHKDSVGGIIECRCFGVPAGLGDPMFGSVESTIAKAVFGIPAVKGIEFGAGFAASSMTGSKCNDEFELKDGKVATRTNNAGGILGGIANGMPIVFRVAFKPTSSIGKKQRTVDLNTMTNTEIEITGRHDPCLALRAVPVVEAVAAICLADLALMQEES
ncbi:chorismate synthase [Candidatus Parvarchaeota archaeon]|nr:chorismate synthase [Candidatus Parvarchaeota archaeon]